MGEAMRATSTIGTACGIAMLGALLAATSLGSQTGQRVESGQRVEVPRPEQPVVDEFQKALDSYMKMRGKAVGSVKPVSKDATPQELDANQTQTIRALATARADAKPGDIFRPAFQEYLRRRLSDVFSRPDGKAVRSSILDENPVGTAVRINGPYPDVIPLTTMPPQVLEVLPKLPKDLEYRFVGSRLILFDAHAHMVIDYVDNALPGA